MLLHEAEQANNGKDKASNQEWEPHERPVPDPPLTTSNAVLLDDPAFRALTNALVLVDNRGSRAFQTLGLVLDVTKVTARQARETSECVRVGTRARGTVSVTPLLVKFVRHSCLAVA